MRDDLAHLTPEALAQLTNAGLVKRAVRELAAGAGPRVVLDEALALHARFADGIECHWPAGTTIRDARCSCGAAGVCRHRVMAVLAWREQAAGRAAGQAAERGAERAAERAAGAAEGMAAEAGNAGQSQPSAHTTPAPAAAPATRATPAVGKLPITPRDIGDVSDEELARLVPAAQLRAAERTRAQGIAIDLRRRAAGEPCDTARLPSATVRYWAGGAIEAARCDCVAASACEHVALGVWAFREARQRQTSEPAFTVRLGTPARGPAIDTAAFHALVHALLLHGVGQGSAPLAQACTAARETAAGAAWLGLLLAELETWAEAYAQRSALYEAGDGVDLVAELALRLAAGALPGNAGAVLGQGQAEETALDRLRLTSLGARTRRDGERRITDVVLADTDTGTRLVLQHTWQVPQQGGPFGGADETRHRAAQRVAPGVLLEALARGQLLAQQAARRADGSLRLARARSSLNSVLPQAGDWAALAPPLRCDSVAALRAQVQAQPHVALQPRHAARHHVVFSPATVQAVAYDAGPQSLMAVLEDAHGGTVLLQRAHEAHVPHALDAIAAALAGRCGPLRHVAGTLHWQDGAPHIEPWALACDQLVVPDIAGPQGALADVPLGHGPQPADDACTRALHDLKAHLATALHHGATRLPQRWRGDGEALARRLRDAGLEALAQGLHALQAPYASSRGPAAEVAQAYMRLAALRQLHLDAMEAQRVAAAG